MLNWKILIRPKGLIFFCFINSNLSLGLKSLQPQSSTEFLEIIENETSCFANYCHCANCSRAATEDELPTSQQDLEKQPPQPHRCRCFFF